MTGKSPGIRQRSPGTYTITVYSGRRDQDGKYQRVTETLRGTKRQAEQRRAELIADLSAGRYQKRSRETVKSFLMRWLATKADIKENTRIRYEYIILHHICPLVGHLALTELDAPDILALHSSWRRAGLSSSSISCQHVLLHGALKQAMRWRLIQHNPASDVDRPARKRGVSNVVAPDDLVKLIAVLDGDVLAVLFRLLIHTGMRMGEALGLRWRDVNLETGLALIVQERTIRGTYETTKSEDSTRTINLDKTLVRLMRVHKATQTAERRWATVEWPNHDLICCYSKKHMETTKVHRAGQPWTHALGYSHFKRAIKQLGLNNKLRPHDLRHTHASIMLSQGADLKVVQERLGHSSPAITLSIYAHQMPGRQQEAVDKFAASLEPKADQSESDAI